MNTKEPKWKTSNWNRKSFQQKPQGQCYRHDCSREETIPEKDMQLLKDFLHTILNPAKLPDTATGIRNHGPESLERLIERHADAS